MAEKRILTCDPEGGIVYLDGVAIDVVLLDAIAEPNARVLWRFEKVDDRIVATPYSESEVMWLVPETE